MKVNLNRLGKLDSFQTLAALDQARPDQRRPVFAQHRQRAVGRMIGS
jgi:hypothetical protein